jgi:hypothetical protein
MEAILRLLRVMSRARPVVLSLDDIHLGDPESLASLEYLADRLGSQRVLCVATERAEPDSDAGELVTSLLNRRVAARIELAALSQDRVEEMTGLALGTDFVPPEVLRGLNSPGHRPGARASPSRARKLEPSCLSLRLAREPLTSANALVSGFVLHLPFQGDVAMGCTF